VPFPTDECKKLKDFVAMAKQHGVSLVPVLVKKDAGQRHAFVWIHQFAWQQWGKAG
jgi:hypothetical protein